MQHLIRACFAIAAAMAATINSPARTQTAEQCFGPTDKIVGNFRVFRYPSRPPLRNDDPNYKYYPLTDTAGSQASIDNNSTVTNITKNYFMWANICDATETNSCVRHPRNAQAYAFGNPPAMPQYNNSVSKAHILFKMTSYARANACTMAQAAYALGNGNDKIQSIVSRSGLEIVDNRSRLSGLQLDADHMFRDVCVMPDARLSSDVRGVMLDYEVHDGRSPSVSRDFLIAFANLVHASGREAILYTNPLNAPGQKLSGLDRSNLNAIQAAFDMTTVFLLRRRDDDDFARDFSTQVALLSGPLPLRAPLLNFDVARSNMRDASIVRQIILSKHLPGVILLERSSDLSGPCTTDANRKIACLVQGRCEG